MHAFTYVHALNALIDLCIVCDAGPFNAGVFVVRNSPIGRHLIDEWLSLYPEEMWTRRKTTGRWQCRQKSGERCLWALEGYEQGAFKAHHLRTENLSRNIHTVSWRSLNNPCSHAADIEGIHVCHFSFYDKKKNIEPYVRSQARCMPGTHALQPLTKSQTQPSSLFSLGSWHGSVRRDVSRSIGGAGH